MNTNDMLMCNAVWLRRALLISGLCAFTMACGEDTGSVGASPDTDAADAGPDTATPDAGPDTSDAAPGGDTIEDTFDTGGDSDTDAEAPIPAYVAVEIAPARSVFPVNFLITPTLRAWSEEGVEIGPVEGTFTVNPEAAAELQDDGRLKFLAEGSLVLEGCANDDRLTEPLCSSRTLVVDAGAPTLEIITPTPGTEFLASEVFSGIEVTGRASDTHGEIRVFVNGQPVTLQPDGTFATEIEAAYGINHIEVIATDVLRTDETRQAVDVLVAQEYLDYVTPVGADQPIATNFRNAVTLQLNQGFLDANLATVPDADVISYETTDLAGILELLFRELELTAQLPDPLVDTAQLFLRATEVDPGTPRIDIIVTTRGVEVFVAIPELFLRTQGSARLGDTVLDLNGGVGVSLSGFVRMRLRQRIDEDIDVAVELVDLAVESITGYFASPQANAIVALAETSLFSAIENVALDLVNEQFLDELPAVLGDAVGSIDDLLGNQTFPLDLGFGAPITLTVGANLETLTPSRRTDLTASLGVSLGVDQPPVHPESRGIALNAPLTEAPSLFQTSRVQIALRLPVLNGLLHSIWNAGLLELDVTSVLPEGLAFLVDRVEVSGQLPPIIRPARAGESDYAILITVGQLELTLGKGESEDVLGAYLTTGANLLVEDNRIIVQIQPEPTLDFWQISVGGDTPIFEDPNDLRDLILAAVWPEISAGLIDNLAIELPRLGTEALGELAPNLSTFALQVVLDRPIVIRDGYLIVDGGLDGDTVR
jgi:hypothetical protein